MNRKILPVVLFAAGLSLVAGRARAQSSTFVSESANGNDLYLGFEESGSPNNLIVDIGPDSKFLNATSAFTLSFGVIPTGQTGAGTSVTSLLTDLNTVYTTGWASSSGASALKWGVAGDDEISSTLLFFTEDSVNPAIPKSPSITGGNSEADKIDTFSYYLSKDFSTVNSSEASSVPSSASSTDPDPWSVYSPSTNGFGTGLDIEQSPSDGPLSTLNLFEEVPTSSGGANATDLGTLALESNGSVVFTPESVPEPSTWASIIGGGLLLGLHQLRRRRLRGLA
jgi:hypothetical protein